MDASLLAILTEAEQAMSSATDPASLENIKAQFLGKQGKVTELLKGMAALSPEEKKTRGAEINQLKQQVEAVLNASGRPWLTRPCKPSCRRKPLM